MNTAAHDSCGNYIANKFESFGAKVYNQYADSKLYDGTPIKMRNIVACINPDANVHILISGHWDSRPWADHDEDENMHHTPIDGANDGASSIGVMLEMARILNDDLKANGDSAMLRQKGLAIDFICWDAEDSGTPEFADNHDMDDSKTWCLGSQYWAGVRHVEGYTARYGINLDMVGGNKTIFYKEGYSMRFAPALVDKVWSTASKLGYTNYFSNETCGYVTDDHVQVNLGGIPCIDIIGADAEGDGFPSTWHTMNDNIDNINKQTLKAIGQTMLTVLWNE
jgi:Zn-dependent M28 family amino/carboxypeptidase